MSKKSLKTEHLVDPVRLTNLQIAAGGGPVLVLTHDNPDPDALAAGAGLAYLLSKAWGIETRLGYSGLIARAENKAMLKILTPVWQPIENLAEWGRNAAWALVDTQPGAGNNSLPAEITPKIVIDHHNPIRDGLNKVSFVDVRPEIGATSTMVYHYLKAANLEADRLLATAIFYGIQADTLSLSRGGSTADQEAYFELIDQIDRDGLVKVIQAELPREYYQAFSDGLKETRLYGRAIVSYLGLLHRPDFTAELADALIRLEGTSAALCMGHHDDVLYLSLRTPGKNLDAGRLIQEIITPDGKAGGHGMVAGGQIPIRGLSPDVVAEKVKHKFLNLMHENGAGISLLSR